MTLVHTCCVLLLVLGAHSLPGRVPKVYNALITSGQNLAPSKSFPVYQPVYHEAFGFPLSTYYYGDDFRSIFGDSSLHPQLTGAAQLPSGSDIPTASDASPAPPSPPSPPPPPPSDEPQPDSAPTPAQPPAPPATRSPIPLNEFGLPPAIVPLPSHQNRPRPTYAFDPFAHFSPYYPQFDPYSDPYSFQSYPLLPPVYRFGGEAAPRPALAPAPSGPPAPATPAAPAASPPAAPSDLDLNNYSGKDPSIPDVPPPPLPGGGLKDDSARTN